MYNIKLSQELAQEVNARIMMCSYNTDDALQLHPELTQVKGYVRFKDGDIVWIHYWMINESSDIIDPTYVLLENHNEIESYNEQKRRTYNDPEI